ncbi:hypothetical protein [Phaeodactylibacter xiamenensis]|uniref:hypothetical protein n=1 Tax=Phaeodactylibacter xiamenensis TaxID=1524460 RepID=UPI0024A99A05|nr:hypothetical protein [Phaeodactylibacter xiamenensis]
MSNSTYGIRRTAQEIHWLKKTWLQCYCTFVLHTAEGFDFHRDELERFEKDWRHQMDMWKEDPCYDLDFDLEGRFLPFSKEIKAIQEHHVKLWGETALSSSAKAATELGMSPQAAKEFVDLKMKVRHLEKRFERMVSNMPIEKRRAINDHY